VLNVVLDVVLDVVDPEVVDVVEPDVVLEVVFEVVLDVVPEVVPDVVPDVVESVIPDDTVPDAVIVVGVPVALPDTAVNIALVKLTVTVLPLTVYVAVPLLPSHSLPLLSVIAIAKEESEELMLAVPLAVGLFRNTIETLPYTAGVAWSPTII